jgi:hypothetical protein
MTPHDPPFDPEVEALLEHGRIVKPVPDVVRARSLSRARAAVAAAVTPHPEPIHARWRRILPIALAASIALAVGAAGAVAALGSRAPQRFVPLPPLRPAVPPPARLPRLASHPAAPAVAAQNNPTPRPLRAGRPASPQESYAAELDLLQRAQTAYASRDFGAALVLVAEHGRRFPNGRLAEEREALRVRSLAGAGRTDQAARAAAAFAERFPRSVLLPRLRRDVRY